MTDRHRGDFTAVSISKMDRNGFSEYPREFSYTLFPHGRSLDPPSHFSSLEGFGAFFPFPLRSKRMMEEWKALVAELIS